MGAVALRDGLTMRRRGAMVAMFAAAFLSVGTPAFAGDWDGTQDGGGVDVGGGESGDGSTPGSGPITIAVPGPWTQRVYVPNCDINEVRATGRGVGDYETVADVLCGGWTSCSAEEDNSYRVFERAMGADNRATEDHFSSAGTVCRSAPDPSESEPPTVSVADIMDRARALAPTPTFVIEPATKSYVNVPTNVAAEATALTVNVTVLGFTVPVEFTPGDVRWSFGDGGTATGVGIRNADVGESGAVEHVYGRSGDYAVTVTVDYDARILIPGGTPITFPTPIARTSAPQGLEVGEIQSVVTQVD